MFKLYPELSPTQLVSHMARALVFHLCIQRVPKTKEYWGQRSPDSLLLLEGAALGRWPHSLSQGLQEAGVAQDVKAREAKVIARCTGWWLRGPRNFDFSESEFLALSSPTSLRCQNFSGECQSFISGTRWVQHSDGGGCKDLLWGERWWCWNTAFL